MARSYQTCSSIQGTQITVESSFISRFTMNNEYHCTKTAKMLYTQNCHQNCIKNAEATKFISQSACYTSKGRTCKVLHFYSFWFKFYDKFRSSTFYAYLITKIESHDLNKDIPDADGMKSYSITLN